MSQRWFITGSSRGIGRALSEAVLNAGHRLVASAREPALLVILRSAMEMRLELSRSM